MEIRPVPLYYGMMAFGKAIVAARRLKSLATLTQAHGIRDSSTQTAKLRELTVRIEEKGAFQEFNDAIRTFEGISYFEEAMTKRHPLPTAESSQIAHVQITLKEILARIPGLRDLYRATFDEEASTLQFILNTHVSSTDAVELRIDLPELYHDRTSLQRLVDDIRARYPILKQWRFSRAGKAWDNSILIFDNVSDHPNEFSPDCLREAEGHFNRAPTNEPPPYVDFRQLLEPVAGGITQSHPCFVQPIDGVCISDVSLLYIGVYLLSSLVRYRPQIWVHAVSRYATPERPADDQALALVERFMGTAEGAFLSLVPRALTKP
jgi:hypothetical protein